MDKKMSGKILLLTVIAGRKQKDSLLTALLETGVQSTNILYGKGSVSESTIKNIFGFIPEENKVIIICLVSDKKAESVLNLLIEKFHFNLPNTGIGFTIPIEKIFF